MNLSRQRGLSAAELGRMCLDHLAQDAEMLAAFMTVAGYDPAGLRGALGSASLNHGLLDHFAQNEGLMLAFCAANALRPEDFMRVWHGQNRHL